MMTKEEFEAKLLALSEDEEFKEKAQAAKSIDELRKVYEDAGIGLDEEDFLEFVKVSNTTFAEGEVSEEDLENVAGGFDPVSLALMALGFTWSLVPGKTNRDKTQYLINWYYKHLFRRR